MDYKHTCEFDIVTFCVFYSY